MTTSVPDAATLRALPKVELHCHLEGSVRPATIIDLARKNGVELAVDDPTELYEFENLTQFLDVYSVICASLRTADDFRRITYESLQDGVAAGVRYREMFFSPGFIVGADVSLTDMWAGIRAGLVDAHADLDIRCRMILDVDKGAPPASAVELVEFAAEQDRDELIGIGGDNSEHGIDHRTFAAAFDLAGRSGLRRTMHAGEDGPSSNVAISIDVLGCERIDHGVRLVEDPDLLRRVAEARIPLTVCPISNLLIARMVSSVSEHPFEQLRDAGVLVTINSDDPGMTGTTIVDDFVQLAEAFDYDFVTVAGIALDAIDASWAPADERRTLTERFQREIAAIATTGATP